MKVVIKLISLFLLSSLAYSKAIYNSVSIHYSFGKNSYFYEKEIKLDISEVSKGSSALTIIKSSYNRVVGNHLEVTFNLFITVNRDISDLIIGDEIAKRLSYQDGTLLLNGVSIKKIRLSNSALSVPIGNAKKGESYTLSYVVRVN